MKTIISILMAVAIVCTVNAKKATVGYSSFTESRSYLNAEDGAMPEFQIDGESDSLLVPIITRSDVPLSFANDELYPWSISSAAVNGNTGIKYTTSMFTFSYTSKERTELSFDWMCRSYDYHRLQLYIDGVYTDYTNSSSYSNKRYFLDAGTHIITLKDTIGNSTNTSNISSIDNISVKEIKDFGPEVLTEKSQPIAFTNNGRFPWTIEDGYVQSGNYGTSYSVSEFSAKFTIDKLSKFTFEYWANRYDENTTDASNYHLFSININGSEYTYQLSVANWNKHSIALEPGEYTVVFRDDIYNTTTKYYSRVRNIEVSSEWLDVELATAGSLGVEVLYKVDVLKDVEMLKVKGNLNSTDWTNIGQMSNLLALDLTEAKFDAVPNSAFSRCYQLSNVKLSEGVKTIGEYAFNGKPILDIDIPSSVTSIGQYAFALSNVRSVNFKEDSKLKTIGYRAFDKCSLLKEFIMPNTVTTLQTYNNRENENCETFNECSSLKKIQFSNSLKVLGSDVCYNCPNLAEVILSQGLQQIKGNAFYNNKKLREIDFPESLLSIGSRAFYNCSLDSVKLPLGLTTLETYAFYNCDSLKYIELPSYIESYNYCFNDCGVIEKVVCRSATPPSVTNDPFSSSRSKSYITLVVPSFAVVNYKLDTYWYQFGSIVEGDDIDYWKITSALSLTNNRRMNGKPDIDLYYNGCLTVGGNAPMEMGLLNYYAKSNGSGRMMGDCPSMSADSINTYYNVSANTWYFFTPVHDVDLSKVSHSAGASYVFRYYDGDSRAKNGTGNSWRNVDSGKLLAGQGYIFHCNKAGDLILPAEATGHAQFFNINDVAKTLNAYESASSANKGWNYVGNPYPAYYDIYYMDFTAPITVWTGSTYKAYSVADDNYVLRPMQSFFVQKPDEIDNIIFHKEGRQLSSSIERPSYAKAFNKRNSLAVRCFFNLQITDENEEIDETRIVINECATLDYEVESDASKFMSLKESVPQIFSTDASGNGYAINERPISDSIVNLAYRASAAGYYTISATRADGDILLYDKKTKKTIDLTSQDYYFYSESTDETDSNRFCLKLKGNSNFTNIESVGGTEIKVSGSNGCINIECNPLTKIIIYTADGRKVCEEVAIDVSTTINLAKGVYVVKVNDSTFKTIVF